MDKKNIEAIYPLSPSQQGMLFESLSAAGSDIHIEQSIWMLKGDVNAQALDLAWQEVVNRHPILRTAFVWKDQNEPIQVVLREVKVLSQRPDWRKMPAARQQEVLNEYIMDMRQQGFSFARAPLLNIAIFQTGDKEYYVIRTFHHILLDGWSLALVNKEFLEIFAAYSENREPSLEPVKPYKDYISWLKLQNLSEAQSFWRERLKGFTRPIQIGMDREGTATPGQKVQRDEETVTLSSSTSENLKALARQNHITMNTLVQAAWSLLLTAYTGQKDVVFGATTSGRPGELPGVEEMVGLFFNTLPIRVQNFSEESDFWSYAREIQDRQWEQKPYEYCSAGQVHGWSELPSSLPLYESILVFENHPGYSPAKFLSNLNIDLVETRSIGARTRSDLTLLIFMNPELKVKIIYNIQRFDKPGIADIMGHFMGILENMGANPDQNLKALIGNIPLIETQQTGGMLLSGSAQKVFEEASSALIKHPDIREAVVISQDDHSDDKVLLAYVVPETARFPKSDKIFRFLRKELPSMSNVSRSTFHVVIMDTMPLTPEGEINVSALPAPKIPRPEIEEDYVSPRDELERGMAIIWEDVLGIHPIGIRDDFFLLGKHSLVAANLFSQIQKTFGKNLPITTLFQAPTIEQLASVIRQKGPSSTSDLLVPIRTGGSRPPLFFIHGCGGEVMIYGRLAGHLEADQPFYGIRAQGMYGEKPPHKTIEEMAACYVDEIRKFQPEGPYYIGTTGDGAFVAFETAQQLLAQNQKMGMLLLVDAITHADSLTRLAQIVGLNQSTDTSESQNSKPGKQERSGRKFTIPALKRMIKHRIFKYKWRFAYSFIPGRIKSIRHSFNYIEYVRNNLTVASSKYTPKVYPGKITYFLTEKSQRYFGEFWYKISADGLDLRIVPGDHGTVWKEPNVQIMAEELTDCLSKAGKDE